MIAGFKKFIVQGNVIDLAVGVVVGAAFGAVIGQFTTSFIDPIVKAVTGGGVDGGRILIGDDNGSPALNNYLDYGAFINAVITFIFTMFAIYFFVVVPMNNINERRSHGAEPEDPSNEEKMVALLEEIAKR